MSIMVDKVSLGKCFDVEYSSLGSVLHSDIRKPNNDSDIWDHWREHTSEIDEVRVCFSGGIDSQFNLQVFKELGKKIRVVTYSAVWDNCVINASDLVASQRYCKKHNLPLDVVELDLQKFLNSGELLETTLTYKTTSPQIAAHLKFLSLLDNNLPLVMGGESTIFTTFTIDGTLQIGGLQKSHLLNIVAPYYSYANKNNLTLYKELFYLDPEVLYLSYRKNIMLAETKKVFFGATINVEDADNSFDAPMQFSNRINAMHYKAEFYKSFGVNIDVPILKNTGFENIKKHMAITTGVYNDFDIKYRLPIETNFLAIDWYKNFNKISVLDKPLSKYTAYNEIVEEYKNMLKDNNLTNLALYNFDF